MPKKRGIGISDNVSNKRRSVESDYCTPNTKPRNILNDRLLNLYKQDVAERKEKAATLNETPNTNDDVPKTDSENTKTPIKSSRRIKIVLTLKHSTTNFSDVGGMDDIIRKILKMFVHMKSPTLYPKLGIPPVRGILLHGPPGCGKTHLARAIAGEMEIPFLEVAATELVCGVSGESEGKIRDTFDLAIKSGRCILFIDEIDAISPKRESTDRGMERRMVAQMLKCLDELHERDPSSNVMVIAATNIPDSIDTALRRGGRFDRELAIGIPNEKARFKILQVLCKKLKLDPDFNISWLAHHTPGYVGADLKTLISEAVEVGFSRIYKDLLKCGFKSKLNDQQQTTEVQNILKDVEEISLENELQWFKTLDVPDEAIDKLSFKAEDFQEALKQCVPYAKREGFASVPSVTWEDIGALEEIKQVLRRTILRPVQFSKFYQDNNLSSTKGILLYGPKGCGKTLLAKAIANEGSINFLSVSGPELLNMYVGESERAVRKCFERARNSAPCVIFFDEIDALCPSRTNSSVNAATDRVVNQLLTEMDGVQDRKQVFVVAATNRLDRIDSAMKRPGRLEKVLYVDLPSPDGRIEILKSLTRNKTRPKISDDTNLIAIALDARCEDFSGADLAYLVREATTNAMDEIFDTSSPEDLVLSYKHFDDALNVIKPSFTEEDRKYFKKISSHA